MNLPLRGDDRNFVGVLKTNHLSHARVGSSAQEDKVEMRQEEGGAGILA